MAFDINIINHNAAGSGSYTRSSGNVKTIWVLLKGAGGASGDTGYSTGNFNNSGSDGGDTSFGSVVAEGGKGSGSYLQMALGTKEAGLGGNNTDTDTLGTVLSFPGGSGTMPNDSMYGFGGISPLFGVMAAYGRGNLGDGARGAGQQKNGFIFSPGAGAGQLKWINLNDPGSGSYSWTVGAGGTKGVLTGCTEYSGAATYSIGDLVFDSNHLIYESLENSNMNNEPSSSPSYWSLISDSSGYNMAGYDGNDGQIIIVEFIEQSLI